MTREDLIQLLKEYKQNKAKLNIKLKELKLARIKLKDCDDTDTNTTSAYGENQDIHSKNKISNKVLNKIEENDAKRIEIQKEIQNLEETVKQLRDKVESVEDRLEGLQYKEREILIAYYVEGKTAEIIGEHDYEEISGRKCSGRYIRKIVKKATSKMINI